MRRLLTILAILCGPGLALAGPAVAAGPGDAVVRLAQSDGPTLSEAVEQVRRQYNGRIVSAETKRSGNREVHHIKVLTEDGKVKTVTIQGRTLRNKG